MSIMIFYFGHAKDMVVTLSRHSDH